MRAGGVQDGRRSSLLRRAASLDATRISVVLTRAALRRGGAFSYASGAARKSVKTLKLDADAALQPIEALYYGVPADFGADFLDAADRRTRSWAARQGQVWSTTDREWAIRLPRLVPQDRRLDPSILDWWWVPRGTVFRFLWLIRTRRRQRSLDQPLRQSPLEADPADRNARFPCCRPIACQSAPNDRLACALVRYRRA